MAFERSIATQGIILKKRFTRENDALITLFSPDLGKIQATARGARKITSHFGGHLETLNICELQLYKTLKNYTVTQCQSIKNFKTIRENLEQCFEALLIVEIFEKTTAATDHGHELFQLFQETLTVLEGKKSSPLVRESFKLKLLDLLGVMPDISRCFSCQKRWKEEDEIWMNHDGHLSCKNCKKHLAAQGYLLEFNLMKLVYHLIKKKFGTIQKIRLQALHFKNLENLTKFFLQHHLQRDIFAEELLQSIS